MGRLRNLTLFIALLFIAPLLLNSSLASTSESVKIQSTGSILAATLPRNLAVIPDDWGLTHGSGPTIIFVDTGIEHTAGNPSLRLEAHTNSDANTCREIDGSWYSVKPGDHIVCTVWVKTSASETGDTNTKDGGRIGIDLYARTTAGYGIVATTSARWVSDAGVPGYYGTERDSDLVGLPTDPPYPIGGFVVPWNSDWAKIGWDIYIPSANYSYVDTGGTQNSACTPIQIDSFVLWLDGRSTQDTGKIWFADATLYINP